MLNPFVPFRKNTPLERRTGGQIGFLNTESGAGLQVPLLDRTAEVSAEGVPFIGWANNHFNDIHFKHSLETKTTLEMGIGQSLILVNF